LCASIEPGRETDFVGAFAYPYVGTIIGDITGTRGDQTIQELRSWFELMEILTPQRPDDATVAAAESGTRRQLRYYEQVIVDRKANPRGDLTSELVHAEVNGERLDDHALRSCLDLLIGAGLGTTTHTLGNAIIQLAQRPELFALLKTTPAAIPAFIEEVLRFDPATHCLLRYTTADVAVGETVIPKGALVLLVLAAANRDPDCFANPEQFDIRRENNKDHIAFGAGPHVCIGSALARLELKTALETITAQFDGLSLGRPGTLEWILSLPTHGTSRLPVILHKKTNKD
jgi:cytochrome P450